MVMCLNSIPRCDPQIDKITVIKNYLNNTKYNSFTSISDVDQDDDGAGGDEKWKSMTMMR